MQIQVHNLGHLPTAPLDDFHELQEDFKLHDEEKMMKLALIIVTRGFKYSFKAWRDPDGKLWIIDAHQRKKALMHLRNRGMEIPEIPYEPIYAADKKEAVEEIAAYNSEFAQKNPDTILFEKYQITSESLSQFNLDLGVEPEALDLKLDTKMTLTEQLDELDLEKEYAEADLPEHSITRPGDIWLLGQHRLMCGDSCSSAAVATLMNDRRADLLITDPPYNVEYEGKTEDALTIANDSMSDDAFDKFLFRTFKNMYTVAKPGAAIYVFHSDSEGLAFRRNFARAGFKLAQCCVWVKNSIVMGRQDYQWQHEPVLYGWREGKGHRWYADRSQSTVWHYDKPTRNDIHPTMKPVALISYPLLNSSKEGDVVVDLFCGSGSTLMACEQHKRVCYTMELLEKFVDATVSRYIHAVGSGEVYLLRDGKKLSYEEAAAQ